MTAEIYLRRALLAPIIVPILAGLPLLTNAARGGIETTSGTDQPAEYLAVFLVCSLCLGGIPYLWMLYARRDFFRYAVEAELEDAWRQLPLGMVPYYWRFWGALTVLFLVTIWGAITIWGAMFGFAFLIAGTIAVPILGYVYLGITFAFLRIYQWLGLIEKGTTR